MPFGTLPRLPDGVKMTSGSMLSPRFTAGYLPGAQPASGMEVLVRRPDDSYLSRMPRAFTSLSDLLDHGFDTLIDVRSPAEFAEDHVPGAINLPALSDAERAEVGTIYKQESPFKARKIGAALVARNVAAHLEGPLADKDGGWRPLVYCWRGGQRSGSVATILSQIGWRAETIEGGYQSFRRLVAGTLHDQPLPFRAVLVDGNTGTGKTEILHELAALGAQVLDLEGLAHHRGSLFGGHHDGQPSQKAFETGIAVTLSRFKPDRPVVIEAESSKIGDVAIPPSLWKLMRSASVMTISAPLDARADYLVRRYADLVADRAKTAEIIQAMKAMQGRERVAEWLELLKANDLRTLVKELMTHHYDPRYAKHAHRHQPDDTFQLQLQSLGPDDLKAAAKSLFSRL